MLFCLQLQLQLQQWHCLRLFPFVSFACSLQTKYFSHFMYDEACERVCARHVSGTPNSLYIRLSYKRCIFEIHTLMHSLNIFFLSHAVFFGNISNVLHILHVCVSECVLGIHKIIGFTGALCMHINKKFKAYLTFLQFYTHHITFLHLCAHPSHSHSLLIAVTFGFDFCCNCSLTAGSICWMFCTIQGIATGKYHAAVLTNNEEWETKSIDAGRISGDLVAPIVYCPELHFSEFASSVADMKNSVAVSIFTFVDLFAF